MSNNTLENSLNNTLQSIRIVMIQTSHTGNIGAAARAMKVMGLSELYLVKPKSAPDAQSVAMSSNATDILDNAVIVDTLSEAISDCQLVVGTSARHERTLAWDIQDSRSCGELIAKHASSKPNAKVAVLFGRESSGLTNEELAVCQHLVHIPTNPDYSSLNVASAVQILSYECRLASMKLEKSTPSDDSDNNDNSDDEWVSADNLDSYFEHLKQVMVDVKFLDPENPRYLLPRLRRLYSRSGITHSEMNILRGMLAAIQKSK
ncbi:MAG: RNA methyltransferase [Cocleimonas sp.]